MTNLTTLLPGASYGDLLTTTNNGQGLTNVLNPLQDGLGNNSPVTIATNAINFNRAGGNTFQLDGIALTATATALNTIGSPSYPRLYENDVLSQLFIGNTAGNLAATGTNNVAVGFNTLNSVSTGSFNMGFGELTLHNLTTGTANIAYGASALGGVVTGSANTAIGYNAGSGFDCNFGTFVGNDAAASVGGLSNVCCLGNFATVSTSNSLILGSGCNIGIGTSAPLYTLDIRNVNAIANQCVLFLQNTATIPGTPVGGGVLYVNAGALTYKGSSGTVTVLGPA